MPMVPKLSLQYSVARLPCLYCGQTLFFVTTDERQHTRSSELLEKIVQMSGLNKGMGFEQLKCFDVFANMRQQRSTVHNSQRSPWQPIFQCRGQNPWRIPSWSQLVSTISQSDPRSEDFDVRISFRQSPQRIVHTAWAEARGRGD